jgi:hypothetical protein
MSYEDDLSFDGIHGFDDHIFVHIDGKSLGRRLIASVTGQLDYDDGFSFLFECCFYVVPGIGGHPGAVDENEGVSGFNGFAIGLSCKGGGQEGHGYERGEKDLFHKLFC